MSLLLTLLLLLLSLLCCRRAARITRAVIINACCCKKANYASTRRFSYRYTRDLSTFPAAACNRRKREDFNVLMNEFDTVTVAFPLYCQCQNKNRLTFSSFLFRRAATLCLHLHCLFTSISPSFIWRVQEVAKLNERETLAYFIANLILIPLLFLSSAFFLLP